MKALSGRLRFVVLTVIVIVAVVSCCPFPVIPDIATYSVEIEGKQKASTYVEWKGDGAKFEQALQQIRGHNDKRASYCFCVIRESGDHPKKYKFNDKCRDYDCPPGNIRTVKVTKSKAADKIAAGESVANDPNVMHRVQSPYPDDISKVLDALK